MNTARRLAKRFLIDSSKTSFWDIVEEAKITDEDKEVLDLKFIHGLANVQIAMRLGMSLEKVNGIIKRAYDKIARLL